MGLFEELPLELWCKVSHQLSQRDWSVLGLSSKYMASTVLHDLQETRRLLKLFIKCPLVGTHLFIFPGESFYDVVNRYKKVYYENEELEQRLPSTIKVEPQNFSKEEKTKIEELFRLYKIWKERQNLDEIGMKKNQEAFEYFHAHKEEIQSETMATWGYNISESMFSFLAAAKANYHDGIDAWVSEIDSGEPMGMLKWLLHDRHYNLVFSQVNERPVDIRLNERFWDEPQIVTAISGIPSDNDRYSLYYDRPDLPTCVVQLNTCQPGLLTSTRTLLEVYADLFLRDICVFWFEERDDEYYESSEEFDEFGEFDEFDESDAEAGELDEFEDGQTQPSLEDSDGDGEERRSKRQKKNEPPSDDKLIRRNRNKLKRLFTLEQLMKFEKVFGFDHFGPILFLEKRSREFTVSTSNRFVVPKDNESMMLQYEQAVGGFYRPSFNMGIFVGENVRMIEDAQKIISQAKEEYELFEGLLALCKRADNFLPVLEWYQENKCTVKRPLPDLETSIELAYSRLGLRPYAELYKLLVWQLNTPEANKFNVYHDAILLREEREEGKVVRELSTFTNFLNSTII